MEKLIAIESDDWGSLRVRNYQELESRVNKILGVFNLDAKRYNQNDTLESVNDIKNLTKILEKHKTVNNPNGVLINFISVTHNPNFQKIKDEDYKNYYRESIADTYKRYDRGDVINTVLDAIQKKLIHVEFHGTEHINFPLWIRDLQKNIESVRTAFDIEFWGFVNLNHQQHIDYQAAYELDREEDDAQFLDSLKAGINEFENIWGYTPTYFVPPNGPFPISLYSDLKNLGIEFICEPKNQRVSLGNGKFKRRINWLGKSHRGIRTLTRNAFFEPNSAEKSNWVESCLSQINSSFNAKRPVILSTHRVNYIGGLNPENAEKGLSQLDELLYKIILTWPDVKFVKSIDVFEEWSKTSFPNRVKSMFR